MKIAIQLPPDYLAGSRCRCPPPPHAPPPTRLAILSALRVSPPSTPPGLFRVPDTPATTDVHFEVGHSLCRRLSNPLRQPVASFTALAGQDHAEPRRPRGAKTDPCGEDSCTASASVRSTFLARLTFPAADGLGKVGDVEDSTENRSTNRSPVAEKQPVELISVRKHASPGRWRRPAESLLHLAPQLSPRRLQSGLGQQSEACISLAKNPETSPPSSPPRSTRRLDRAPDARRRTLKSSMTRPRPCPDRAGARRSWDHSPGRATRLKVSTVSVLRKKPTNTETNSPYGECGHRPLLVVSRLRACQSHNVGNILVYAVRDAGRHLHEPKYNPRPP